jgi:PAS domain S-box-containing protein
MNKHLRVLIVEDRKDDAELVLLELRRAGYEPEWKRVCTPEAFSAEVQDKHWDVILADYQMPRFTGLGALEILKKTGRDVPFIIVSGSVGEAIAVEAMKAGAHDFFAKTNLTRLAAAIDREVNEARVRHERQLAVEQLREAEERYRLVIEHVRDYAIFFLDAEGRIATWNPGAKRTLGHEQQDVLGHSIRLLFPAEELGRLDKELERARSGGFVHEEGFMIRKGGAKFWAERDFEAIREAGEHRGYAAIVRDAGERKRLVDEMRQAVRARDEFLSIASHELKTPLTSLQLQVDSLKRLRKQEQAGHAPMTPEVLDHKIDVIARQAVRLEALVANLLEVTRIASGSMTLQREDTDLSALVNQYVARSEAAIRRAGSPVDLTAEPVIGRWDRLKLEAVVENLLSNALKYGARKPISIRVERSGDRAVLTVADGGIGIPVNEQGRIFERFERAVPEQHYGGLGVGLWIARQVVEAHGGTIYVASEEGKGSTFTVELPLHAGQEGNA